MNKFKVEGYRGKWSPVACKGFFALLENVVLGDLASYLLIATQFPLNNDGKIASFAVVGETYDDIETAIEDLADDYAFAVIGG